MPEIAIFVTLYCADSGSVVAVNPAGLQPQLQFLESFIDIISIETYVPEDSELNDQEAVAPPVLIVQINMADVAAATTLAESQMFANILLQPGAYSFQVSSITDELTEIVHYPVHGESAAQPRTAPVSYVVRYYGPVEDAAGFVRFYTDNHPPILSRFNGLRNVICYLPLGWASRKAVTGDELIIGNEVVFDNQQALSDALASEVREQAREDGKRFQPFGYNTHHVMRREMLFSRTVVEAGNV